MKKFWKSVLSNLGLVITIGGVSFLAYIVHFGTQTNLTLAIAAATILSGFVYYTFY